MEIQCSQGELPFTRKWKGFKIFTPEREQVDKETGREKSPRTQGSVHRAFQISRFQCSILSDLFGYSENPIHCRKHQSSRLHGKNYECFYL